MAPASTMPWMELAADISGVCRVAGTLLITSIPTSRLSTKMVRSVSSPLGTGGTSGVVGLVALVVAGLVVTGLAGLVPAEQRGGGRVDDPATVGDDHAGLDLVAGVDGQAAVAGEVLQQRGHVAGVGGGCGGGN